MDRAGSRTRAIGALTRLLRARGVELDHLCDGLEVDLARLEAPRTWVSWATTAELLERISSLAGGRESFITLVGELTHDPLARRVFRFGRIAFTPERLYRLVVNYIAPSVFPAHHGEFEVVAPRHFRVTLSIPEDLRGSEEFFWASYATYLTLPRAIGLENAAVDCKISPHRGEYEIRLPPSHGLWARWVGSLRVLLAAGDAADELIHQQEDLHYAYRELREAYSSLEARAVDLQDEVEQRRRTEAELRRREQELDQARKVETLGRLAGGIAHDFNNVLTAVAVCAELLESQVAGRAGDELALREIREIRGAVDRASGLTRQLLAFSRRQPVAPTRLDVGRVITEQLEVLRRILAGIELHTSFEPEIWTVVLDAVQLQQIVLNLVVNARDAMPNGGLLRLRTENVTVEAPTRERRVRITVEDTGQGMDEDTLPRIFDAFFTTRGAQGTGLGLATVESIVAESGGSIDVESTPGRGAAFHVEFPAVEGSPDPFPPPRRPAAAGKGNGEAILLVEDDKALLRLLSRVLEAEGYRVYTARSAAEALRVAEALEPALDLVVSDVLLADGRGRRTVEQIQRDRPETRALLISAVADPEPEAGTPRTPLLRKPFSPSELLREIRSILEGSSR